ncbi:hypothetical protein [Winogradskyella bathintestinalis]|uniref:O-antigen ligase domain-containing protein n=1 Tax=Winogradskyella bathintestinalis TaxID=3035208 RepID=A0ABT7ZSW8_9FLAO|nr:hypothetical protein [Winogradskyella bathintestinalis]MDN3492108.1 hypothetical protein [Winogradskyella bathintestinalis]
MKYWSEIKYKLTDHITVAMQLLLLMLGIYIFIMAEKERFWKIPMLFIGLMVWFFLQKKSKHPIIWIAFFALLVFDLYHFYFRVANHHFMLMFMVLPVIFYMYHQKRSILLKNIQMLLVIVILTSVVQKLLSSQFMSGDFYYYMMNKGSIFGTFLNFFPDSLEVAQSNRASMLALYALDPNEGEHIVLNNVFPYLGQISFLFAWATVAVEFLVAIAILWKPRHIVTHLLFLTMILGILCTRLETGFMALLAICGIFLCHNIKLRLLYVMIVMGCIALVVTKLGYH